MKPITKYLVNNHVTIDKSSDIFFYDKDIKNVQTDKWVLLTFNGKPAAIEYFIDCEFPSKYSSLKLRYRSKFSFDFINNQIWANTTDILDIGEKEWNIAEWTPEYRNLVTKFLEKMEGKEYDKIHLQKIGTITKDLKLKLL